MRDLLRSRRIKLVLVLVVVLVLVLESLERCGFENVDRYLDRIEFFVPTGL